MPEAPLRVTVEIQLLDGPAAGQRRFRLSKRLALPPSLDFPGPLPLEGEGLGQISFLLPLEGPMIMARALLRFDPEHPERGSRAELVDLSPELLAALQSYINDYQARMTP